MKELLEKASEIVNEMRWLRAQQCVRCGLSSRPMPLLLWSWFRQRHMPSSTVGGQFDG